MIVENGAAVNAPNTVVGVNAGSTGTLLITGTGTVWTDAGSTAAIEVGESGTGTMTISNGAVVTMPGTVSDNILIGQSAGSSGLVTVTGAGSEWLNSNTSLIVGSNGFGTLAIENGGTVSAGSAIVGGSGTLAFGANPTFTINNTLIVNRGTVTLVDNLPHIVTLNNTVSVSPGSTFDFEIGNGSDELALSLIHISLVTSVTHSELDVPRGRRENRILRI